MKVYAIGGLGTDERVFQDLNLDFELSPLLWIDPQPQEDLQHYAQRLSHKIDVHSPFAIIGVSFGGIMALELNKVIKPRQVILISSAISSFDIPFYFRLLGRFRLFHFLPEILLKPPPFLANWFFGIRKPRHKDLLRQIIKETDPAFLRWACIQIARWKNSEVPKNLTRIHGTGDRMLKCMGPKESILIEKGGHFMIMERAHEISHHLNAILSDAKTS